MATLIRTNLSRTVVSPADPEIGFTFEELYQLLGCEAVNTIALPNDRVMVTDADGQAKGLFVNLIATKLYVQTGAVTGPAIVGDVLIADRGEVQ